MAKSKKNYNLPTPVTEFAGNPDELIVHKIGPSGDVERTFDFSDMQGSVQLRSEIALAFRNYGKDKVTATCTTTFYGLKRWLEYIDCNEGHVKCARDVGSQSLNNYIVWLNQKRYTIGTRHSMWSCVSQIFKWLKRYRPQLCNPDLEIPFNAFPRKNAQTKPRSGMSRNEIERVLAAAKSDIDATWKRYQCTQELLKQELSSDVRNKNKYSLEDLRSPPVLLHVINSRFSGFIPEQRVILKKGSGLCSIYLAIQEHGGAREVASMLYPFAEHIIPYMIAIGAQTFANPEGLRCMKRNCVTEHLLLESRAVVNWDKGRSKRPQQRSFLVKKRLSVPRLIEQVITITEPLHAHAPENERNNLFLVHSLNLDRRAQLIPNYLVSQHVERFIKRHGLTSDEGGVLYFSMATLRTTGLTLAHEKFGFDVLKTQAVANHYSPDTTMSYVDNARVKDSHQNVISKLQRQFIDVARKSVHSNDEEYIPSPATELDAKNATATGFTCSNPLSSPISGQREGVLCTAWLGCFTCPNAVIPLTTDALVRLLSTKAALQHARETVDPDRWRVLYQPKLEILENDILSRFPENLLLEAESRELVALPIIE